jgi:hypothetical protein
VPHFRNEGCSRGALLALASSQRLTFLAVFKSQIGIVLSLTLDCLEAEKPIPFNGDFGFVEL